MPPGAWASLGPALRHGRGICLTASRRAAVSPAEATAWGCRLCGTRPTASMATRMAGAAAGPHPSAGDVRGHTGLPYWSVLRRGQGRPAAALPSLAECTSRTCFLRPVLPAFPASRPVAADPAGRSRPARAERVGCPPGRRPGRETSRVDGKLALAAEMCGVAFAAHATCARHRCRLTSPLARWGIPALSVLTAPVLLAVHALAGCPPGQVQVPCWSADLEGIPVARAALPGSLCFPVEAAWPAIISR